AKAAWLRERDDNTALFHSCLRKRTIQNNVYAIRDRTGVIQDSPEGIQTAFVDYYNELLGRKMGEREKVNSNTVRRGPVLTEDRKRRMITPFTREGVKKAIFSIHGEKSLGPDGFGTNFYKHNWDLIGEEVTNAILDFFKSGKLLKEINNTFLVFIPKVPKSQDVSEFRPIACYNTIFKGIAKLLCLKLKEVLPDLISEKPRGFCS
ncbi:hypothetical protein RDABS01_003187, partial [Bienertia sinuspersici]